MIVFIRRNVIVKSDATGIWKVLWVVERLEKCERVHLSFVSITKSYKLKKPKYCQESLVPKSSCESFFYFITMTDLIRSHVTLGNTSGFNSVRYDSLLLGKKKEFSSQAYQCTDHLTKYHHFTSRGHNTKKQNIECVFRIQYKLCVFIATI